MISKNYYFKDEYTTTSGNKIEQVIQQDIQKLNEDSPGLTKVDKADQNAVKEVADIINKRVILTNKELRDIIKEVWKEGKLDVLVMYNCIMQNMYTQYELRDCVDYLVAPVSGICYPGYSYRSIFANLFYNVHNTNDYVANLFISTIRNNAKYYEARKKDIEGRWKLCSVQLNGTLYNQIVEGFKDFLAGVLKKYETSPRVFTCINNTIGQCFNYATYCLNNDNTLIDLLSFLRYFSYNVQTGYPSLMSLKDKADLLIALLVKVKSNAFVGSSFFPADTAEQFIDQSYETNFGFGLVLQRELYQQSTLQYKALLKTDPEYASSFLEDTNFYTFYELYARYNGAVLP